MANNNNCYYNAAYIGCMKAAIAGRPLTDATAADYLALTQACQAFAQKVDSLIAHDATVSTGASPTMLVDTANHTKQSDTWFKPQLLQSISEGIMMGRRVTSTTQADYATAANAVVAAFTEALLLLVSP